MAKFVLKKPVLKMGTVLFQDRASSLEITTEFDEVDFTAFGSDWKEMGQGLGDATWTINFFQDFATNKVDDELWTWASGGGTFQIAATPGTGVTVAAQSTATSTHPMYVMQGRVFSYAPIAGAVGEASTTTVSVRNAAATGLRRRTSGSLVAGGAKWW